MQGGDAEVDEGVGAALIGGARVGRGGDRGERVDRGHDRGGALGGQQRPQFAHAVLARADADSPFGHRVGAVLVDPGRVQGVHRAAHGAFELGQRLPTRPGQYPCLHRRGDLSVEGVDRFGEGHRVQVADPAPVQRLPRLGQHSGQGFGDGQAALRGERGQPQRTPDLLTDPPIRRRVIGGHDGQHLRLHPGQPGRLPFQGDQRVDPTAMRERGRVEQRQRRSPRPGPAPRPRARPRPDRGRR